MIPYIGHLPQNQIVQIQWTICRVPIDDEAIHGCYLIVMPLFRDYIVGNKPME